MRKYYVFGFNSSGKEITLYLGNDYKTALKIYKTKHKDIFKINLLST